MKLHVHRKLKQVKAAVSAGGTKCIDCETILDEAKPYVLPPHAMTQGQQGQGHSFPFDDLCSATCFRRRWIESPFPPGYLDQHSSYQPHHAAQAA